MIDIYRTEEEQIAALKSWWLRYWMPLLGGVGVAVASFMAWQLGQQGREQNAEGAAVMYGQLMETLAETEGMSVVDAQRERVDQLAQQLQSEHPGKGYADFAALARAKYAVAQNDLAAAEEALSAVLGRTDRDDIRHAARIRLARVKAERGAYVQALDLLEATSRDGADPYRPFYLDASGDVHWARGNQREALRAYRAALDAMQDAGGSSLLRMKIDEAQSVLGETPAGQAAAPAPDSATASSGS